MSAKRFTIVVFLMLLVMSTAVWAQEDDANLEASIEWVVDQQQPDGSWTDGFSEDLAKVTADTVFALASWGIDPAEVVSEDGNSALDYFAAYVTETEPLLPGRTAAIVTALMAAGEDPTDFADMNLVEFLLDTQDEDGVFVDDSSGIFGHCLVMTALYNASAGEPIIDEALLVATDALIRGQNEDGGFGFAPGLDSDTNTTGMCVQAVAGLEDETAATIVGAALEYLGPIQNEDGGWPYQNPSEYGTDSDANSTAMVLQALIAADVNLDQWDVDAITDVLLSLQNESGSFSFNAAFPGDNMLATVGVIPALNGWAYNEAYLLPVVETE